MTEKIEFRAVNLRHPMMIFWFLALICFSSYMIFLAFIISNIWISLLFSILSSLTPFMLYYSLTSKVIIENKLMMKKSILGVQTILFKDIKAFGVYKQEGNSARMIGVDEYNKKDWFGQNFIFVATREDYSPLSFKQKGSIRFHFYQKLYDIIDDRIKACQ